METNSTEQKSKSVVDGIINTVKMVITDPAGFYRTMPKTGGFGDPLVFMVVLGVVAGIVRAILGVFHLGFAGSTVMALAAIVMTPIFIVIFGFVGAAVMFVIWKVMGSSENYETAYRCCAYTAAVSPITAVLGVIPFAGSLIGLAWGLYLIVTASVEVHKIAVKTAWLVFGIIAAILALMSVSSALAARRISRSMQTWQQETGTQNQELAAQMNKTAAAMSKALEAQMKQAQVEAEKAASEAQKQSSQQSE